MSDATLDRAMNHAFEQLEAAGGDPARLEIPLQTVVVVFAAQGIIDNGGLELFFESDFPGQPPYSFISDAYRRIGAVPLAECIDSAAMLFPFEAPHLAQDRRRSFLAEAAQDPGHLLGRFSDSICGDEGVWTHLNTYILKNRALFSPQASA